ncbi:MAG: hypothetical protein KME16_28070 [Scytolyngbya sp. HA4215-MV1]|nr:hypothetical protein [Scytolyngbya sp. HA4215-MV1]
MGKNSDGTETKTRRTNQRRYRHDAPNCDRQPGLNGEITGVEGRQVGIDHDDWTQANPDIQSLVTGGILAQLIEEVKDQLGDAEQCIEWYQREKERAEKKLETLEQLAELLKNQE